MPPPRSTSTSSSTTSSLSSTAHKTTALLTKPASESSPAAASILHNPTIRVLLPFLNGGTAGMIATTAIQPIDMIKVRIQLAGAGSKSGPRTSPLSVTKEIIASGRILDLYTGLSAGLLRQAVYTTARLGFFDTFIAGLRSRAEKKRKAQEALPSLSGGAAATSAPAIGFKERAAAGLAAGGLAACVGNPADLALIRMQSDGLKPASQRSNYTSVLDALTRISRSEGISALWAGAGPTVVRAMALNFGQLAFFSEAKAQLKVRRADWGETTRTLTASAVAGFFASFFSLPFDFVKTRLQRQSGGEYRGMADCFRKVAREEGLLRFYRGFGTYFVRIAPHT